METARELFEHELRDMYDAENKLLNALESMASKVTNPELESSFSEHRSQTEGHIKRLDQVFGQIDRAARREPCKGITGLIQEFSEFIKDENPSEDVLNVFAAAAALKTEHYEICGYRSLIRLADLLGLSDAAELLQQNLKEEEETAQLLEAMSEKLGHEVKTS